MVAREGIVVQIRGRDGRSEELRERLRLVDAIAHAHTAPSEDDRVGRAVVCMGMESMVALPNASCGQTRSGSVPEPLVGIHWVHTWTRRHRTDRGNKSHGRMGAAHIAPGDQVGGSLERGGWSSRSGEVLGQADMEVLLACKQRSTYLKALGSD